MGTSIGCDRCFSPAGTSINIGKCRLASTSTLHLKQALCCLDMSVGTFADGAFGGPSMRRPEHCAGSQGAVLWAHVQVLSIVQRPMPPWAFGSTSFKPYPAQCPLCQCQSRCWHMGPRASPEHCPKAPGGTSFKPYPAHFPLVTKEYFMTTKVL